MVLGVIGGSKPNATLSPLKSTTCVQPNGSLNISVTKPGINGTTAFMVYDGHVSGEHGTSPIADILHYDFSSSNLHCPPHNSRVEAQKQSGVSIYGAQ